MFKLIYSTEMNQFFIHYPNLKSNIRIYFKKDEKRKTTNQFNMYKR
jgi:hypothetical protein